MSCNPLSHFCHIQRKMADSINPKWWYHRKSVEASAHWAENWRRSLFIQYGDQSRIYSVEYPNPSSNSCIRSMTRVENMLNLNSERHSANAFLSRPSAQEKDKDKSIPHQCGYHWAILQNSLYSHTLYGLSKLVDHTSRSTNLVSQINLCMGEPIPEVWHKSKAVKGCFWKRTPRTRTQSLVANSCNDNPVEQSPDSLLKGRKKLNILFRIICWIRENLGINTAEHPIMAPDHNSVSVCLNKLVV